MQAYRSFISFDLDGTVILQDKVRKRSEIINLLGEEGIVCSLKQLAHVLEMAGSFYDTLGFRFRERPAELWYEYSRLILEQLGSLKESSDWHLFEYYQAFNEDKKRYFVDPEMYSLLEGLKSFHVILAAISSNLEVWKRVQFCSLDKCFEHIYTPLEGLPKAQLFQNSADTPGWNANHCYHVGDDWLLDYLAPREYGIKAILFDPESKYSYLANSLRCVSYAELRELIKDLLVLN
jgi:FMN phosphatase YigB (HAD superfamily)